MNGSIRVINKGKGRDHLRPGEIGVHVDRTNPELGNPYILRDKKSKEQRNICCDQFERMAEHDMRTRGPIYRAVAALAERVLAGEKLALGCWCKPERCHADWICDQVRRMASQRAAA